MSAYRATELFLDSGREGLSPRTVVGFHKGYLNRAIPYLGFTPTSAAVNAFLISLTCSEGGKHACFRAMRVFYRGLYSPRSEFTFRIDQNTMTWIDPPKTPKLILPSLSGEEVELLIEKAHNSRDKAIISLFVDSGLRLSELTSIEVSDINWDNRLIKLWCKGNKEGLAPFGQRTEQLMKGWLSRHKTNGRLWGLNTWGIVDTLKQPNAHLPVCYGSKV